MEFTQEQLKEMEELDKFYTQMREEEENEGDEQTAEMAEKNEGHRALYNLWAPSAPWDLVLYAALD